MGEALAGRRRWIWIAAAAVVLALIVFGVTRALTAGASVKPKAAATVAADRGAVTTEVATTGTVEPAQTRSLSFAVSSTVTSVKVSAGSAVTAGEVLATVDSTDAQTAVDDAQTSVDQARTALTTAQDNASKTSSTPTASSTKCSSANLTAYDSTKTSVSPTPSASASPSASPSAKPSASATRTSSPVRTTAPASGGSHGGSSSGSSSRSGSGSGSGCSSSGSGSSSGGSATSGGSGGSGQQGGNSSSGGDAILSAEQRLTSAETTLDNAEDALEGTTIKAPIRGRILTVSGGVGTQVSSGSAFFTLADVYNMQITASFPEADAGALAVSQPGTVTLAAQADKTFKTTLVQVDPTGTSDGTMVTYGVVLSFVDAPTDLLVGQSANVTVTTGSKTNVLRVPSTAVHGISGDTGTVRKNGVDVKVTIGLRGDQYTEIVSGLSAGDQVVRSW